MKKICFLLFAVIVLCSHDMYLKLDTYFLQPDTRAAIKLFNGTFDKSDNVITRDRMIDVSIVGGGVRTMVDTTQWSEKDSMTILSFNTGRSGTYVAGVSTLPRDFAMEADVFNTYLEHDGIFDMIDWRKANNAMNDPAVERYSKHVKTIYQVGDVRTDDWSVDLGYPIEFIPQSNPYDLKIGDKLIVKLLRDGQPLRNQLVYADHAAAAHSHSHDHGDGDGHSHDEAHDHNEEDGHTHTSGSQLRTDDAGNISVDISSDGIWYIRTIHLVNSEAEGLTHESNWATLTFEVGHVHDHSMRSTLYWIGGLGLLILAFILLRKKGRRR